MCQYQVTSKGLALVVSAVGARGSCPLHPDCGKLVNPIPTRGGGNYAQHITICPQIFQIYLRPYQVPGLGPSFEKCEKGKGFPLSFQPKFEFYLLNMAWQSLASLVHTLPCILPKLTFFRNRSQGSFLFDIVQKLCLILMISSSDGFTIFQSTHLQFL